MASSSVQLGAGSLIFAFEQFVSLADVANEMRDGQLLFRIPEFFSDAVAIGEVHGQRFLPLLQQLGRQGVVAAFALQLCHALALIGYLAPSLREVSLGGLQSSFKHCSVHTPR
jgi:hypothetical protein